jgi:hypothetical protein
MIHWLVIILGIMLLSLPISNPFYKLILNNFLLKNLIMRIIFKIILFFTGIIIVFLGLYIESLS